MKHSFELSSPEKTREFGRILGNLAEPGDVITLQGSLGAGKTTLTQAVALGLEIDPRIYITSPTFSLLHEYQGRLPLYHMDFYRLSSEEEIESIGLAEYFSGNGLTVIEWPERLGRLMPPERLEVELVITGEFSRKANLAPFGPSWQKKLAEMETLM